MSTDSSATPLASFESKWTRAHPEFGLALRFCREPDRADRSASACLVYEIEHAAFGIREMQPAAIKLQWWAEELTRAGQNEARHPLTQALASRIASAQIPTALWHAAIVGALAQRDPEPAGDAAALLDQYGQFYGPVGAIEAALFGTDASALAGAMAVSRALRETAALKDTLRDGKLPLPLDVLARHRLARGDLATASSARAAALRDWLRLLAGTLSASTTRQSLKDHPLGVMRAAMAAAASARARSAGRARDPLAAIDQSLGSLSVPVVWASWRAARRSPA